MSVAKPGMVTNSASSVVLMILKGNLKVGGSLTGSTTMRSALAQASSEQNQEKGTMSLSEVPNREIIPPP